jgi:hypothetical protein
VLGIDADMVEDSAHRSAKIGHHIFIDDLQWRHPHGCEVTRPARIEAMDESD